MTDTHLPHTASDAAAAQPPCPPLPAYAIIVAGGKGQRMGGAMPKQFLPIGGRPVLMHTLETFSRAIPAIEIILVLPTDQQPLWQQLCDEHHFTCHHTIVSGGETRFHSVLSGLRAIPSAVTEAIVGVHDGVRPFVSADVIRRCYTTARTAHAVVPVIPVVESLRQLTPSSPHNTSPSTAAAATTTHTTFSPFTPSHTVPRDAFRLVQTPQTFTLDLLRRAFRQPYTPAFTDDATVVEAIGHPIALVEGNRENIKLTTPFDLTIAEALLSTQTP